MKPMLLLLCLLAALPQTPAAPEMSAIQWLEPAGPRSGNEPPPLKALAAGDPRIGQAERLIDNEAARFVRALIAGAWRLSPDYAGNKPLPPLPIAFQPGGNNARTGFYLVEGSERRLQADTPYVVLDLDADRLSLTLLHEGGHVADRIARRARRQEAEWSPLPHSTFAVTDRITALREGYAIHLETMWGHYGADPARRAFYDRVDPAWAPEAPIRGEFFTGVRDLMNFSQTWARYSAVRDGLAMFEGHAGGEYLRSQYDPSRDYARLKTASAAVASEGVVASVLFWIAEGSARAGGAQPQKGLAQRAILDAELQMLRTLASADAAQGSRPIDLADVVSASGARGSESQRRAIERFVAITRGVTADPSIRPKWRQLYANASNVDVQAARGLITELDRLRGKIVADAVSDPASLRALLGPVLPVRLEREKLRLVALGEPFPLEFDLNAMGWAEIAAISADPLQRRRIAAELDLAPFTSIENFETRTGVSLASIGAAAVR